MDVRSVVALNSTPARTLVPTGILISFPLRLRITGGRAAPPPPPPPAIASKPSPRPFTKLMRPTSPLHTAAFQVGLISQASVSTAMLSLTPSWMGQEELGPQAGERGLWR